MHTFHTLHFSVNFFPKNSSYFNFSRFTNLSPINSFILSLSLCSQKLYLFFFFVLFRRVCGVILRDKMFFPHCHEAIVLYICRAREYSSYLGRVGYDTGLLGRFYKAVSGSRVHDRWNFANTTRAGWTQEWVGRIEKKTESTVPGVRGLKWPSERGV